MANQGLNSGVIIPLGKMGVRITPALSHFTVQPLIGETRFPTVLWIKFKNSFLLTNTERTLKVTF